MKIKMFFASLLCVLAGTANAQSVSTATYSNASDPSTRTLAVSLNHSTNPDFVAFVLQLDLPEGTTVTGVKAMAPLKNGETIDLSDKGGSNEQSVDFLVPFNQIGTKCNIVGYNFANKQIGGNSGDVLLAVTLKVENATAFDEKQITTSSSFVNSEATEASLEASKTSEDVARLWGDINRDTKVNASDVDAAIVATATGNSNGLDHFATNTGIEGAFKATDVDNVIKYAK